MRYRQFGKTGLTASAIGFGCNRIADPSRDRAEVLATLHEALDRGLNYFDTADAYNHGESERLLGEVLRGRRDRVILCSKAGKRHGRPERIKKWLRPYVQSLRARPRARTAVVDGLSRLRPAQNFEPTYIVRAVERSLRRLRTDYLDVFLFHNPSPELVHQGRLSQVAADLKARGLIRYHGVACGSDVLNSPGALEKLLADPALSVLQIRINISTGTAIREVLPLAGGREVAVVAFEPLGKGSLIAGPGIDTASRLRGAGRPAAELALRFVLDQAAVSVVLVGMTNRRHLAENLAVLEASPLTADELINLQASRAAFDRREADQDVAPSPDSMD